jgi:hypothetical protein
MRPNGTALDKRTERFVIVSFGGDTMSERGARNEEALF